MKSISRRLTCAALAGVLALLGQGAGLGTAQAVVQPGGELVRDVAASRTPHVLDGHVYSVVQVGDQMVLGGDFSRARNDSGNTAELRRDNLLAFDASTGQISTTFLPQPDGVVRVVLPAPDGESVFVGGKFRTIGGEARKNLAQVRISDGKVLPFDAGNVAGQVRDLRLADGRLWLAGHFTHVQGHNQVALATVDARSGAFLPYMGLKIAGIHNGGATNVLKIDVSPNGERLAAVGNFDTLEGVVRHQIFQLDLTGAEAARETDFNTRFFTAACSKGFDTYMRDVDYSPDSSFFVVTTTGAYGGSESACDTSSRFETYARGATVQPSWVNYTGGDTLYAVEVTESVVYVGGHFRWQNNPYGNNRVSYGAVAREGIAALDPANGLPYTWNPGRTRGVGVYDFLVTDQGLWVASDTDRIGPSQYKGRIARMPSGGTTFPAIRSAELPNDVYTIGSWSTTARSYRAGNVGPARQVSGLTATTVKGAFMVNGWLYLAHSDGTFTRRTFDGTTFGPSERVDTADQLRSISSWRDDVRYATGMFYENGRIYYTTQWSSSELRYRYFTPESGVVGAKRMVASGNVNGLRFSDVRGMFFADGKLYWSDRQGVLRRIDWRDDGPSGAPVPGTAQQVSGPRIDGQDWTARDLFLFQDAQGHGAPMAPEAQLEVDCTSLTCSFDASGSKTPGGEAESYAWDLGDGNTATGAKPTHTYAKNGSYTVKVTVTSSRGGSAQASRAVQVARVNQLPTAEFTASCQGTVCTFDAGASHDADGPLTYAWDFGDGSTGTGVSPTKAYVEEGTRRVTLTVTDTDGARATASQDVTARLARVEFAAALGVNGNSLSHRLRLPDEIRAGDLLLLQLGANSDVTISDPEGWTPLDSLNGGGVSGKAWWKRATAEDAGTRVTVPVSAAAKADLSVLAYRGTGGKQAVVAAHRGRLHTTRDAEHTSPQVTAPAGGGWLATYWALKASEEASWSDLGGQVAREGSNGGGGGRIVATVSDSAGPVAAGPAGGLVGRTTVEVPRAIMFSTIIGLE